MKKGTFKQKSYEEKLKSLEKRTRAYLKRTTKPKVKKTKLKRDLMPSRVKRAKKELVELSHTYIRNRDSLQKGIIGGYCFDCDTYAEGRYFQCGHWESDSTGGGILRYHPHNMHGQFSGCNMAVVQERVKIAYTLRMIEKYGIDYVNELRKLKNRIIKVDIIFYERMIELYKEGDEEKIIGYLMSLPNYGTST